MYDSSLPDIRRVGVMGGTFDPIHFGHLVIAEEVYAALHLSEMIFVPAGQPPHKPGEIISAARHRLSMLELAIASNPHFTISHVDLQRPGPSYTVDTLRLLREQWEVQTAIYFVIGGDSLEELVNWYEPARILEQLAYLVAVRRPGYNEAHEDPHYLERIEAYLPKLRKCLINVPAPQLHISATDLRLRVAEGRPIKYQTPEVVEQYILEHGLYQRNNA